MRVLHVVDSLGVGGTEHALVRVIEKTRDQVDHFVCCVREKGATAARLEVQGIRVIPLGKRLGNDWKIAGRIACLCREVHPDVVHTRNWGTVDGILGGRLARVPVVIHGEHGRDASDVNGRNRRRNLVRRLLAPLVSQFVTVSAQLRDWLVDEVGINGAKVRVLINGVDVHEFRPHEGREALRNRYGYGATDVVVGTVGRLDPVKNHVGLLEALRSLSRNAPNVRVVIVGDGPERVRLQELIQEYGVSGTTQLLGHRTDIPALLSLFDVFVLPSLGEGMCNTVLEAMAVGLPVVATAVGGNPELVVPGHTGMLVPVHDADALAQAIRAYAGDSRMRCEHGTAGRERVLEHFTLGQMADGYVSLYRELAG